MSLVPAETDSRILLIGNDDTFAHTYQDFQQMLAEQSEGDELRGAVEFFDITGGGWCPCSTRSGA